MDEETKDLDEKKVDDSFEETTPETPKEEKEE